MGFPHYCSKTPSNILVLVSYSPEWQIFLLNIKQRSLMCRRNKVLQPLLLLHIPSDLYANIIKKKKNEIHIIVPSVVE